MPHTVIQHVLSRLRDIGVSDIFGVPGDYAFPVNDAICEFPGIRWIGCCNELNAAYAADGYARVKGIGALNTTYGVGELSALAGMAGAYAEHVPLFHLVGAPPVPLQSAHAIAHHTLGNGEYNLFQRMSEPVSCGLAVMTPQNVVSETERLIAAALYHRRPVYMTFPKDYVNQKALGTAQPVPAAQSDPEILTAATDAILAALGQAKTACVLPGILIARAGLQATMQAVIDASDLPFATMFMDKSVLEEQQPNYIGMYDGRLMNEDVRAFVEGCDYVMQVGTLLTDLNTGAYTSKLDPAKTISISHHRTQVGGKTYSSVEMGDVLAALAKRLPKQNGVGARPQVSSLGPVIGTGAEPITAASLYPRWANFLQPRDILVAETGTASMGLAFAKLPQGASFHNQTLWCSIGWGTPAAIGAAVAAPDRRVVLVTGEGSHQMTAQEVSQFGRYGLKPVIFVLNNSGYLIERLLCENPAIEYNDLAQWRYSELPKALGCDGWFTARVTTCGEFDRALETATRAKSGVYIEIVTGMYESSPMAAKLGESLKALHKS
jgi:indolepyruvate decarboxylase